jgi:hypothetical protein
MITTSSRHHVLQSLTPLEVLMGSNPIYALLLPKFNSPKPTELQKTKKSSAATTVCD